MCWGTLRRRPTTMLNSGHQGFPRKSGHTKIALFDCSLFGCCSKALNSLFVGDDLEKVDKLNMASLKRAKGVA